MECAEDTEGAKDVDLRGAVLGGCCADCEEGLDWVVGDATEFKYLVRVVHSNKMKIEQNQKNQLVYSPNLRVDPISCLLPRAKRRRRDARRQVVLNPGLSRSQEAGHLPELNSCCFGFLFSPSSGECH